MPRPKSEKELALETQLAGLVKLREEANRNAYGVQMLLNNIASKAPVWCDACDTPKGSKLDCVACFPPKVPTAEEDFDLVKAGIARLHESANEESGQNCEMEPAGVAALDALDRLKARLAKLALCKDCGSEIASESAGGPYCCSGCADS